MLRDKGKKPTEAARCVADQYNVAEATVFKDVKRHDNRLAAEVSREADAIEHLVREKAAGLVARDAFEDALREAVEMTQVCCQKRLGGPSTAKVIAVLSPDERREYFVSAIWDTQLELAYRFAERAKELSLNPPAFNNKYPLANGPAMLFELLAESIKPNMK